MELGPLTALAGLLFVKEAGVPVPVPGDLLVLGAGAAVSGRGPDAIVWLVAILVAGYLGGSVQFLLVRGAMRGPLLALLARFGVPGSRVETLANGFRTRGAKSVAIARATPGVRVAAIAASGIAAIPFGVFLRGLVAGNGVFVGGHFALGFVLGAPALRVGAAIASPGVAAASLVVLAAVGAGGWLLLRSRRAGRAEGDIAGAGAGGAGLGAAGTLVGASDASVAGWADAACPACLAVAAVELARR